MMYGDGSGMGGWGFALMAISLVLFAALVIAGVAALVRYLGRSGQQGGGGPGPSVSERRATPEQLFAQRFARGEIDEDEYRRRLDVLHSPRRPLAKP